MNHPPLQEILMTNFKTLAALMMTALMAVGTASAADGKFGADRHAAMGLTCETCHGPPHLPCPR